MKIYVVTFENDGDFPEKEIALVTIIPWKAKEKIKERQLEYALSVIETWEAGTRINQQIYLNDFNKPDWQEKEELHEP